VAFSAHELPPQPRLLPSTPAAGAGTAQAPPTAAEPGGRAAAVAYQHVHPSGEVQQLPRSQPASPGAASHGSWDADAAAEGQLPGGSGDVAPPDAAGNALGAAADAAAAGSGAGGNGARDSAGVAAPSTAAGSGSGTPGASNGWSVHMGLIPTSARIGWSPSMSRRGHNYH
jgi:hypothetical protein